jgi:hypothetical protein
MKTGDPTSLLMNDIGSSASCCGHLISSPDRLQMAPTMNKKAITAKIPTSAICTSHCQCLHDRRRKIWSRKPAGERPITARAASVCCGLNNKVEVPIRSSNSAARSVPKLWLVSRSFWPANDLKTWSSDRSRQSGTWSVPPRLAFASQGVSNV